MSTSFSQQFSKFVVVRAGFRRTRYKWGKCGGGGTVNRARRGGIECKQSIERIAELARRIERSEIAVHKCAYCPHGQ